MNDRRTFVSQIASLFGLVAASNTNLFAQIPDTVPSDEATFWAWIREQYTISPNIINLNNGGVSPHPKVVQEALENYNRLSNEGPSYYMWRILDAGREPLRENLSFLLGASKDEVAINRNSTEGLNSIIFGLDFKRGDEIILSKQDYPNMINAWKQREKRDGIVLKWVNLELPTEDENYIIEQYTKLISDKTKLIHITHIINWNGQILPVRKIADEAHKQGIEVLVDGAHSFAHLDFKISDLDCDYFATSLHKWLCAPFGTGMMYIRKSKISKVWALLSAPEPDSDDIRKFENLGTRSFATEMAIGHAIDFHELIGIKRKSERLYHLKQYWTEQLKDNPKFKLNTPISDKYSGAIANFSLDGFKPEEIDNALFSKYKIHTVGINWENIHGVRVTPNVYTSYRDLDKLVRAINEISNA